ncbi:phosphoglucosamine mutase [cyanobacterium endosymbiont of Braarudosphaera bigelowii]|uniref:Phosphoglucosamine mutase n=1 Tax=cyanobacterium endosymbiont of Braarudosphaera bigelowii TaxID=1285375 RepID=A0ABN6K1S0_9CHRO|nr:phosphoglucosamine mutase [Candidatus Atelocyanobacterium thalassa]BDA39221.1 phosphoglucosamine mutase [cyanobacterium endosymbiont of Braarudosphaera bigelowii]
MSNQSFYSLNTPLFGTDGIRGKAGDLLTAAFAVQLGFWAGQVLKSENTVPGPIIIGQDSRNSSDMLAMSIASGLTSTGIDVWYLGLCPTPCVAHITNISEAIGGIMISASHNPPEDNGIKFFNAQGIKLSTAISQKIEEGLRGELPLSISQENSWGKILHKDNLINDYYDFLKRNLHPSFNCRGMRIVLDLAWGASVNIAPDIFNQLEATVFSLNGEPKGDLINVNCGSTNLKLLQQAVKKYKADLGFAFDGDADRVMAVDNTGKIIDGDFILFLWGKYLMQKGELPKNLLVTTVMANLGFEKAWEKLGGTLIRTPVGDRHVQAKMLESGAKLGGEQSGHIICHNYGMSGDGIQTSLQICSLLQQSETSLSKLVENSFKAYPQILYNIRFKNRNSLSHWKDCTALQEGIQIAEQAMKYNGRLLVRASGTEPLLRIMIESECFDTAQYWTNYLIAIVEKHLDVI